MSRAANEDLTTKASPEIELLLCCATPEPDAERAARIRRLAGAEPDWERVLQLALHHRTMPLLYCSLTATCPDLSDTAFMGRLHDHFYLNTLRNHALNEELCRILQLLAEHKIPAIPYKGPALAMTAYGDLSLRQFNDLDVMIKPHDYRRVAALLGEQGYEQQWQLTPAQEAAYLRSDCERLFARARGSIFVDVHWSLVRSYFPLRIDYDRLWERLQPVSLGCCVEALTFTPEALLIILCIHAGKDLWTRLSWVADVAELIRTHSNLDWTQITQEANASGARRMLLLGLFLAHDLLAAKLPEEVIRQVETESIIITLASKIRSRLGQNVDVPVTSLAEFLFHLKLHERLREKYAFSFNFATITNPADWAFAPLPDDLFFLYSLLRPLRLLIKRR